jgi:hypothetical protein
MIKARKQQICDSCSKTIEKGERYELYKQVFDEGKFNPYVFRSCRHCERITRKLEQKEFKKFLVLQKECAHVWCSVGCGVDDYCKECGKIRKSLYHSPTTQQWQALSKVLSFVQL